MQGRLAVQLAPGDAALRARRLRCGIDVDAFHEREVDHHAAVRDRLTGHVVPAASHRDLESSAAGEGERADHVGCASAARDQQGPLVD